MKYCLFGMDPGSRIAGLAALCWAPGLQPVLYLDVIRTAANTDARATKASRHLDEMVRCLDAISGAMRVFLADHRVLGVLSEAPAGGQSYKAAVALRTALDVVGAVSWRLQLPVELYTPQQLKVGATGRRDASKQAVEDGARAQFDGIPIRGDDFPKTQREHAWDAVAALCAGRNGILVRQALSRHGLTEVFQC